MAARAAEREQILKRPLRTTFAGDARRDKALIEHGSITGGAAREDLKWKASESGTTGAMRRR